MNVKNDKEINERYEEVYSTLSSKFYSSSQLTNLNRTIQELGRSMYKVTNSPAMEQIANLNQVFVDSAFKFYDSPVVESVAKITQQISETMSIISSSPAMEKISILNKQLAVSINSIYSSTEYQQYFTSIQKIISSLNKTQTNVQLRDLIDSSYLASITNELYKSDVFTHVMESPEEKISTEEIGSVLQQGITVRDYQTLENKLEILLEKSKEPERITRKDIILLVLNILLSPVFQPFHNLYSEWAQQPANHIIEKIKKKIKTSSEQDVYSKIRIVKKDELKIKQSNRRDSPTIGELTFGDVVEIVYKKKNWTKVRTIGNNTILEGWVYTRYLQKIN